MKKLSYCFAILAMVLSNIMCANIAYSYCNLYWCGQYGGCSAPAHIAFFLAIPYGIGIAACAVLAVAFHKKSNKQP